GKGAVLRHNSRARVAFNTNHPHELVCKGTKMLEVVRKGDLKACFGLFLIEFLTESDLARCTLDQLEKSRGLDLSLLDEVVKLWQ
ncbi:hypothetical protein RYX36_003037, partial [Vicia faba]